MNIRCSFCQTPYTLGRVAMLDALQEVDAHNLSHYDAHCPRCRRATQIPRQRLEMAMPNWRDELKQFEAEMKQHPQQEAPLPAEVSEVARQSAPVAEAQTKPKSSPAKTGTTKSKPAVTPAGSRPKAAGRQTTPSADTKKSNNRKTTTKGSSKKNK